MKPSTMLFLACSVLLAYSAVRDANPIELLVALFFGFGTLMAWRQL